VIDTRTFYERRIAEAVEALEDERCRGGIKVLVEGLDLIGDRFNVIASEALNAWAHEYGTVEDHIRVLAELEGRES
jgi:hypothetical protein